MAIKKGMTSNFFSPLSFVAVFGSEIRDPGWVKIRIRDNHPGSATLLVPLPYFCSGFCIRYGWIRELILKPYFTLLSLSSVCNANMCGKVKKFKLFNIIPDADGYGCPVPVLHGSGPGCFSGNSPVPYSLHRYLYDSISVQSDGVIVLFLWETVGLDPVQRYGIRCPVISTFSRYQYSCWLQILQDTVSTGTGTHLSCRIRTYSDTDQDLHYIWIQVSKFTVIKKNVNLINFNLFSREKHSWCISWSV